MNDVQKRRLRYRLALALFGLLVFVTVFGSDLMPHSITPSHKIPFVNAVVNGVQKSVTPPFAPSGQYVLGTDHRGYDILSLLLNGAKYTLGYTLLVTLLRFVLAIPLGLYAGSTGRWRSLLSTMQLITTSVPVLLFIFPSIYGLNKVLPFENTNEILFGMLVFFGIFQIGHQFANRSEFFNGKLFVTAARMMGASNGRIVFRHLLPHLRSEILFAFLTELVQVLFLIGQLAVFNIFLGGGEDFVLDPGSQFSPKIVIQLTTAGEWGGMIAYGVHVMMIYPWILISAGTFLALTILILTFFSKQLQLRLDQPTLYVASRKPLLQNKPALSLGGVAVAVCALLVLLAPNKSSLAGEQAATTALATASTQSPGSTPTAQVDSKKVALVKDTAQNFIGYVSENNWEFADTYVQHKVTNTYVMDAQPPDSPFDRWLKLFSSKKYKLEGVGDVKVLDATAGNYEAEVKVQGPSGKPETWKLQISAFLSQTGSTFYRVAGGEGGS